MKLLKKTLEFDGGACLRPLFSSFLGAIVFFVLFDFSVLDVSHYSWTFSEDAGQHFIGWHAFRYDAWRWPLGCFENLNYPHGMSIVFTDSIPLFAIPFKLFRSILPPVFQYHGIWGLFCYVMAGFFSGLLVQRYLKSWFSYIPGVLFLLLCPMMALRFKGHEALSAHWLLLWALYLYFRGFEHKQTKHLWTGLLCTGVLVHFYLFFMLSVFWAFAVLRSYLKDRNLREIIVYVSYNVFLMTFLMYVLGYFTVSSSGEGGLGFYSMNLLSPFLPQVFTTLPSDIFPLLKSYEMFVPGQWEGFNYLGVGVLALLLFSMLDYFKNQQTRSSFLSCWVYWLPCALLTVLALSDKVTFAHKLLFDLALPDIVELLWSVFRSSGRLFWPVWYMLVLLGIRSVSKLSAIRSALILCGLLCVQVFDLSSFLRLVTQVETAEYKSPFVSELWEDILGHYNHIEFIPAEYEHDDYLHFAFEAVNRGQTLNVMYAARTADRSIYKRELLSGFKQGKFNQDTMYVMRKGALLFPISARDFQTVSLDGYDLLLPGFTAEDSFSDWPLKSKVDGENRSYSLNELLSYYSSDNFIILFSLRDEASRKLPEDFIAQMKQLGSTIENLAYRDSYVACVSANQCLSEELNKEGVARCSGSYGGYHIELESAGNLFGNYSKIRINGVDLSPNIRGINVVVIDILNRNLIRYHFDTFDLENPRSSEI